MLGGKQSIHIFQGSGCNYSVFFGGQFVHALTFFIALLVAQTVKSLSAMQETRVWSLGYEDPLGKEMAAQYSSTLAWKIHGQRSLVIYSPWGCKESDMTEQLHFKLDISIWYNSRTSYYYLSKWSESFQKDSMVTRSQCELSGRSGQAYLMHSNKFTQKRDHKRLYHKASGKNSLEGKIQKWLKN